MKMSLGVSLDDTINDNDVRIEVDGLTILSDRSFYEQHGGNLKIDYVDGQGMVVEILPA